MKHRLRILMNAADASPGGGQAQNPPAGGSAAPAPSQSPAPQAQGDGQAQLSLETLTPVIRQLVRDAINADMRRASSGKQTQPKTENSDAPTAPTFDVSRYRDLDRAITRAGMAETLSSTAWKRIERAFADENPDDAEAWVADYFAGLGVGKSKPTATTTTSTAATTAPVTPTGQPASDRGAPPAAQVPLEERDLRTISAADRDQLIRTKGLSWYVQTLNRQLTGKRLF